MRPGPLRTILTQDVRLARAWLADAAREPWLAIGLPAMAAAGLLLLAQGVRRMAGLSLAEAGGLGLAVGLAGGFALVRTLRRRAASERLDGAFGFLMADPGALSRAVLARAALAGLGPILLLSAILAAFQPFESAAALMSDLIAGAVCGGAAAMAAPEGGAGRDASERGAQAAFGWPALAWRLSSGGRGLIPAVLCAGVATAVALSGIGQGAASMVQAAVFFGALAAGLCLLPGDGALARLLGQGRASLRSLALAASAVPTLTALTAGAVVILSTASLESVAPVLIAAASVAALAILRLFIDLTGGEGGAPLRFGVELALIGLAAAVLAPLAVGWTGLRLWLLGRQASRRRWSLA